MQTETQNLCNLKILMLQHNTQKGVQSSQEPNKRTTKTAEMIKVKNFFHRLYICTL